MYYPQFTKVIIHHFMSKDPSIPRRNKVNWHYVRDDHMNANAYKEYYAVATGAAPPKPKASVRRIKSSSDTSITTPTTAAGLRLTTSQKGKQAAKATKAKSLSTHISQASGSGADEGTGSIPGVLDVPTDESEEEFSWNSTNDEGDDNEGKDGDGDEEDDGEEGDGDDDCNDGNGEEEFGLNVGREEGHNEEEKEDELYRDININQGSGLQMTQEVEDSHVTLTPVNPDGQQQSSSVSSQFVTSMLNPTLDVGMELIFETTSQMDVQTPTSVAPLPMTAPTMTPSTIATITITSQALILPTIVSSTIIKNLPNFGSLFGFDNKLRTLEAKFSKFIQTNQFAGAVSAISGIVQRYMDQRMKNDEFLKTIDENMQKIIKEQVKEQVKVQVSKIFPRIEQTMNEQLEAKVLTRSPHSSKTSYAVAADLSEMELKKILIKKIEGNKYIQRSNKQRNLYKALVEAYKFNKIILDTYRETVTLKRRRDDDADKDEEPSARPDRGESAFAKAPLQTTYQMEEPSHPEFETDTITLKRRRDDDTNKDEEPSAGLDRGSKRCREGKEPDIVIKRRVEDLQLGVKTYQKKLNLTKPDTDGMLTDVHTALDDRLKGIWMKYLPLSIWRKSDKDRAASMIQAIDKRLKTRMIIRSLERFVGGRLYEGDSRILQRTILFIPEPEGSTQGYPLVSVEVLSDAMYNPSQPLKVEKTLLQNSWRYTHFYRLSHFELVSIEKEVLSSSLRSLK
nr:hypothetical protein [Tanacetum cinerariifolium]